MIIKLMVEGGNMKPGPAIAQQLGPKGINLGKVISDINEATKEFKGMNVPVHLDVDTKSKNFSVKVMSPPTSELIKKELAIEKGTADRKKINVGNLAIEQIIAIAKVKESGMLTRDFISSVKEVIGTCLSAGVLVESKDPKEVLKEIADGKYKDEIAKKKTELSSEKRAELKSFFDQLYSKQQATKKEEEEKAKLEAEAKAAAAAAAGAPAPGAAAPGAATATPAAGAAKTATTTTPAPGAAKTPAAKPEAKAKK
jgi:large subunit ribosomal protein L11